MSYLRGDGFLQVVDVCTGGNHPPSPPGGAWSPPGGRAAVEGLQGASRPLHERASQLLLFASYVPNSVVT